MHINDLANFVFLENVNQAEIYLELHGVEDQKDLFYFCLDLFCKGLVLVYGNGGNRVNVEDITLEQFANIQKKMRLVGIEAKLQALPVSEDNPLPSRTYLTVHEHARPSPTLADFQFIANTPEYSYELSFSLTNQRH
jgi:hypothetical protein